MTDATYYDDGAWDDVVEDKKDSSKPNLAKKYGLLFRLDSTPTKVHFSYPEEPYMHPRSKRPQPFRTGKRHFIAYGGRKGKGAYLECADVVGDQCVACALQTPERFGLALTPDGSVGDPRYSYAAGGWIEEVFHMVEEAIDENDPQAGKRHRRERCSGRQCQLCRAGWPTVFGKKMFLELSGGHWQTVADLNRRVQNHHCKCGGDIYVSRFICPKCQEFARVKDTFLDILTYCDCGSDNIGIHYDSRLAQCNSCNTQWSADYVDHKDIYEGSLSTMTCACGYRGSPVPVRFCQNGCDPVTPYGVFDIQLTLRMTGTGKDKRLHIDDWKLQEPDQRLFDLQHQGNDEWAQRIVEANARPIDLNYLLNPGAPDWQAKEINKVNPFIAGADKSHRYARYAAPDQPAAE